MVKVWDRVVRVIHWVIALLALNNFISESGSTWHRYAGYAVTALVIFRLCWGIVGSQYARFRRWWPGTRTLGPYLRALAAGNPPRYLGLNPAGALMAIMLWTLLLALGMTGWMMGWDAFWGEEWLENLHAALAWTLSICIGVHIFSVVIMSIRHRENLPKAMLTGKKRLE